MGKNSENGQSEADPDAGSPENMTVLLDTLEHTKIDLGNVMRRFLRGEITDNKYRCFVYGINSLIKLLAQEKMLQLEERIRKIEERK